MANYNEIFVSNIFKTKDNGKVQEILNNIFEYSDLEGGGVCFGQLQGDSVFSDTLTILFKGNEVIATYDSDSESIEDFVDTTDTISNYKEVNLIDFLQEMLLEGEYISLTIIGWEKLRYVGGEVIVITKNDYLSDNLHNREEELLKSIGVDK